MTKSRKTVHQLLHHSKFLVRNSNFNTHVLTALAMLLSGMSGCSRSDQSQTQSSPPPSKADESPASLAAADQDAATQAQQEVELAELSTNHSGAIEAPQDFLGGDFTAKSEAGESDYEKPNWLAQRGEAQREAIGQHNVFHNFKFADRIAESGIRFRHWIVDDAGKDYKAVHYDHGNGMAVADVDGDGKLDIYFTTQTGENQLWRNLGDGRFADMTSQAGVAVGDRIGVSASFADTDNDGDADLYVTTVRGGNVLFENDGNGIFQDISADSGLDYVGHSSAAVFFDFDRDGLLDLFLCNLGKYTSDELAPANSQLPDVPSQRYVGFKDAFAGHLKPERDETSRLYKNLGENRFGDVTEAMGLSDDSWTGDASPLDANRDGWPDLYVLDMQGHDEYFENDGGQRFIKKSRQLFPKTPWGAMGIKVFDFDNDGHLDIYITDMHSDMAEDIGPADEKLKSAAMMYQPESLLQSGSNSIFGNAFFKNDGQGGFVEISDDIAAENYWPWGLSVGDLNADGFEDAFVASSMNYPFRYGVNSVLLNDAGRTFVDAEFVLGVEPRRAGRTHIPWFDLDCDGGDNGHRECNDKSGKTTVWGALGTRSSVIFDLDDDGDLDIVTNDFNSEPMVLVSNLNDKTAIHFTKIRLVGTRSNKDGLGARVTVKAAGRSYTKVHDGQSGYLSQSSMPLYFGLAVAESIEEIRVEWPSGAEQTVQELPEMNSLLEIVEPK
jgi:hypothetical protein